MTSHRRGLLVCLAAALVLTAGCGGDGAQPTTDGPTETATPTELTTPTRTPEPTETAAAGYRRVSVEATAVKRDAMAAMRAVDTYRVWFENGRTITTNRVTRTVDITSEGAFNRTARTLRVNQSVRGPAGTVDVRRYVTNRTLYERSPAFVRPYDSKWVKTDLAANFSSRWELLDTLTRQRTLLNRSTVRVLGGTTVNGTDAYVLRADVNETAYTDLIRARIDPRSAVNVTNATFTYWVDAETGRPLRVVGTVNSTAVVNGQEVGIHEAFRLRFTAYDEPVDVTLPPAAETAVAIGNVTPTDG